jgi:hypothetical protein
MANDSLLNLSDADMGGFEALDPGRYNAEVFDITWDAVKNAGGRTPVGTPMIKVEFKLTDEDGGGRHAWTQFVVPPKDHDKEKAAKMKGMIARFFVALGDTEEAVRAKDFNPDFEDYKGRPCVVVLGREAKRTREGDIIEGEYNNPVKGVKPAGSLVGGASTGLL